jgi:hypothetical protein
MMLGTVVGFALIGAASASPAAAPEFLASSKGVTVESEFVWSFDDHRLQPEEKTENDMFPCNQTEDCGANGDKCYDGYCVCKAKFATESGGEVCEYERRSRTTAILLSVFLGEVGAGAWYLGWTAYALPALLLFAFACCFPCIATMTAFNAYLLVRLPTLPGDRARDQDFAFSAFGMGLIAMCLSAMGLCVVMALTIAQIVYVSGDACIDSNGVSCY